MIRLYFLAVEPSVVQNVLDDMLFGISSTKKERLLRYRFDIDRKIGIFADVLTRCLICKESGMHYKDIDIELTDLGKPYVRNFPGLEFNLSHTRCGVAAAISSEPVGIDIERIRDVDIGIAHKVSSEGEKAWIFDKAADQNLRFLEIWTKKEAFLKYEGRGLSGDLKSTDVTACSRRRLLSTFRADDYIISVCSGIQFDGIDIIRISEPELIDMWRQLTD